MNHFTSAGAGGPSAVRPSTVSRSSLRVLVIGAGPAAEAMHLPVLSRLQDRGEMALAAVCDLDVRRAESARRRFGFAQHGGDAQALLSRADLDAVYVFADARAHFELGRRALESGRHLFVEKPVAPSYAEALELAEAARTRGLVAAGGHNRRFYRALAQLKHRGGSAGWRSAEAVFHKAELGKPVPFGARTWLSANGIHALDALLFVMGVPDELAAAGGDERCGGRGVFSALLRWSDGRQATFLCNNEAGARREEYVFHAPGETCTITDEALEIRGPSTVSRLPIASVGDGIEAEHEAFLRAVRTGEDPVHSLSAIAPSLFVAELIERGYAGPVRLPAGRAAAPTPVAPTRGRMPDSTAHGAESILIVEPAGLLDAAARVLPRYRWVSLHEVSAGTPRPDVVAALLGRGAPALTEAVLDGLPNLAVVAVAGLSLRRYEPETLIRRGIDVVNASDAYADSAAELALGLAILGRRRAFLSHEVMRAGGWGTVPRSAGWIAGLTHAAHALRPWMRRAGLEPALLKAWRVMPTIAGTDSRGRREARDLRGARVALLGWGSIARALTLHLRRLGAEVWAYSEHAPASEIEAQGAVAVTLSQALTADIVSLHRGLTERTRHFLATSELGRLRPGTVLINVARGALIEPQALRQRLARGDIFACLDTFELEPLPASDPLRRLRNVFLTAHIAGGSRDMQAAAAAEVVDKVAAHLRARSAARAVGTGTDGMAPPDALTLERLETMT